MTRDSLENRLRQFPNQIAVEVSGNGKLVAKIVARDWGGVDEGDRQEAVWAFLRGAYSDDDLQAVEFIITDAPGEQ